MWVCLVAAAMQAAPLHLPQEQALGGWVPLRALALWAAGSACNLVAVSCFYSIARTELHILQVGSTTK